jgi:hypothetical protein
MARRSASLFSDDTTLPLQQGDVFIHGGVARIARPDGWSPPAWAPYESFRHTFREAGAGGRVVAQDVVAGSGLVMVVSHDCHLDKELHLAARALLKEQPERGEDWAYETAEADDELDRHVVVSPIVALGQVPVSDKGLLLAGRVVGYVPVPASPGHGLTDPAVVDLGHRSTVDRLTLTWRLASITDPARLQLRDALARMDSLRTPDLSSELEAAVGKKIIGIERPTGKRLTLLISFEDGDVMHLLPRPGDTPQDGPGRTKQP